MNSSTLKSQFLLKTGINYLNFGSFGATVKPVYEVYQQFQRELEEEPVQFFQKNGPKYLKKSRESLAGFLNCEADDLVYVTNPSYAVNTVARSLQLKEGDEILSTDLEYGACERTWTHYCEISGAKLVQQKLPLPFRSKQETVDALFQGVTSRTRLIFVSHITSTTALILPVKDICDKARTLGIPCFIDGAHAPGQVAVDLKQLDADFYTGACHKWMLTPKGCAFLYTKRSQQNNLLPLVVSWGYNSESPSHSLFLDYHEGQGTRDYSAFLTVPAAIAFMKKNNWEQVAERCRKLAIQNTQRFVELLGSSLLADPQEEFIAQMVSFPVKTKQPEILQEKLFNDYNIEIPVMKHKGLVYLRYSINAFNDETDLDQLYNALEILTKKTALLGT